MRTLVAAIVCLAGCTGDDDGPAAVPPGHVQFVSACAPTTTLELTQASPGEVAMADVFVVNDGDTDVKLGASDTFAGPDAFGITNNTFVCGGDPYLEPLTEHNCCPGRVLPPHAWCQLTFEFRPTDEGTLVLAVPRRDELARA